MLGMEPDGDRLAAETVLGIDAPAPEAGVACPIQHPAEAGAVEDAVQLLRTE